MRCFFSSAFGGTLAGGFCGFAIEKMTFSARREYDRGGRLLWDGEYHYRYDCEGNLVMKTRRGPSEAESKPGKKRKNWFGLLFASEDADADGKKIGRASCRERV